MRAIRPRLPVSAIQLFHGFKLSVAMLPTPHYLPGSVWLLCWPHRRLDEGDVFALQVADGVPGSVKRRTELAPAAWES